VLFRCQAFVLELQVVDLILLLDLLNFGFEVGLLLFLEVGFVFEALVLSLDITLDF